ncbi:MAG: elongation factor Ts [Erysipelotrichia bacterium]|nr:elongation factor Ts [Erysipelotrichia bacterium]NCC54231.1 elongation factor Ts [Erysipelotrichia bacterium]
MITASQVKELREKTSAGMMDCKKALTECDGDMAKAVDWLREKGIAKAAKKGGRIAAEGLSRVKVDGNTAVVFEVNSETDFVAKNEQFLELLNTIESALLANKPADLSAALAMDVNGDSLETLIANATATIGEKITLRRFEIIEKSDDQVFGAYMHMGGKISALSVLNGGSDEVAKDIAMQVASMAPQFVCRDDMPAEYITHERGILEAEMMNDATLAAKPEKVRAGIVEGRLSKQLQEVCLVDQIFFKNPDFKVGKYVQESNASVASFVRYVVGEGIEKREENFAEEVAAQIAGK